MTNDNLIGIALGMLICAIVVSGNIARADAHLVSVYPDAASIAIAPLVVYLIGRRRRINGATCDAVQAYGVRVGAVAGVVFGIGVAVFTIAWLPAWPLVAFGSGVALTSVFVLGCFAGYAAGHSRIIAV